MELGIAGARAHGTLGRIGQFAEMAVAEGLDRCINGLLGTLMAFGERKGYSLAVACELPGEALSGGDTCHQPPSRENTSSGQSATACCQW